MPAPIMRTTWRRRRCRRRRRSPPAAPSAPAPLAAPPAPPKWRRPRGAASWRRTTLPLPCCWPPTCWRGSGGWSMLTIASRACRQKGWLERCVVCAPARSELFTPTHRPNAPIRRSTSAGPRVQHSPHWPNAPIRRSASAGPRAPHSPTAPPAFPLFCAGAVRAGAAEQRAGNEDLQGRQRGLLAV